MARLNQGDEIDLYLVNWLIEFVYKSQFTGQLGEEDLALLNISENNIYRRFYQKQKKSFGNVILCIQIILIE